MGNGKRIMAAMLSLVMLAGECTPVMANELLNVEEEVIVNEIVEDQDSLLVDDDITDEAVADSEEIDLITEDDQLSEDEIIADYDMVVSANEAESNEEAEETSSEGYFACLDSVRDLSAAELADKLSLVEHASEWENAVADVDYAPNEIIVEADTLEKAEEYARAFNGSLKNYAYQVALIELNGVEGAPEASVLDAVSASAKEDVALPAAWPNYYIELYDVEDEEAEPVAEVAEDYSLDSYSDPYLSEYQYQHTLHATNAAWSKGFTGKGVKVAVIDSGVRGDHEDLKIAGVLAYNANKGIYESMSSSVNSDIVGHGTHCAGIIGARYKNGKGGAGIAPEASVYMIRNCTPTASGGYDMTTYACIQAVNYVGASGFDVASMSFGSKTYVEAFNTACTNAYLNGVALFASSGNDGNSSVNYPASYSAVTSVGSVDQYNTQASFSNKNDKVRYTGAGVSVFSTLYGSKNSYGYKSGTSMACPSIAAVAADILSSGEVSGSGKTRVNNLLAIMDNAAIYSGEGGGKGTVSLEKVFGKGSAKQIPDKPTATINDEQPITSSTLAVRVSAELGNVVYYTLNGKTPDATKNTVGRVSLTTNNITNVYVNAPQDSDKLVLKMIAVNPSSGLSSGVATYTYTFKKLVTDMSMEISNGTRDRVLRGSSVSLKALVTPENASLKKVKWELAAATDKVTLTETGKLTVKKDSQASTISVKATAKDKKGLTKTFNIQVLEPANVATIKSVTPSAKSIDMYVGKTAPFAVTLTKADGSTLNAASLIWTSSDSSVAQVTGSDAAGNVNIKSYNKGKVTIYGAMADGSGKKVSVKVNVKQQLTTGSITGPCEHNPSINVVTKGKSIQFKLENPTRKADNKKVIWSLVLGSVPAGTTLENCGVQVNKNTGKVTTSKTAVTGNFYIRADAADGQGWFQATLFEVVDTPITNIQIPASKYRVSRQNSSGIEIPVTITGGKFASGILISVSNEKLVSFTKTANGIKLVPLGVGTGSVKVTVKAVDGSNKKATCTVNVVNPPSYVRVAAPKGRSEYIAAGKTLKLTPKFGTGNGPLDSEGKKVAWSSSNPGILAVDSKGVVKNVTTEGSASPVTIYARSTDGLTGSYTLYASGTIMSLSAVYDKNSQAFVITQKGKGIIRDDYITSISNKRDVYVTKGASASSQQNGVSVYTTYYVINPIGLSGKNKFKKSISFKVSKADGSGKGCSISKLFKNY